MEIIKNSPPPVPRQKKPRLTAQIKKMSVGDSVVAPNELARCAMHFHRYHGRKVVQKKISDTQIQFWIIE